MARHLTPKLRDLILSMNLGRSSAHRLAGWFILELMSRHGSGLGDPITLRYLVRQYNADYLEPDEAPMNESSLKKILTILIDQARLVSETTRKVRIQVDGGKYVISFKSIYRITSSGIEFLNAMQRVVNAENTVVASTRRIDEFVNYVGIMRDQTQWQTNTVAFHDHFVKMLEAFQDVMNGMRKLDADLREIATDLSFNHASDIAQKLQTMLQQQASPAYRKLQHVARDVMRMARDDALITALGHSAMAEDNLDAQNTIGDAGQLLLNRQAHMQAIRRQLSTLAQSFDPTSSAIQNSFDSIYLLFETLWAAVKLLTAEFDHVQRQTVDIKALNTSIDELLTHTETLSFPEATPTHLPMDRLDAQQVAQIESGDPEKRAAEMATLTNTVRHDLLEAGSFQPVRRFVKEAELRVYTDADNPTVVVDEARSSNAEAAIQAFSNQVMQSPTTGIVSGDLTFDDATVRDLVVVLYSATQYADPASFAVFGRPLRKAEIIEGSNPVRIHLNGVAYVAVLPHAYRIELGE